MHLNFRRFLGLAFGLGLLGSAGLSRAVEPPPSLEEPPWIQPFTDDIDGFVAAATAIADEDDDGIVFLAKDAHASFGADGERTYRGRLVYRIVSPRSVRGWGQVSANWKPWHQYRPEVRARVLTPEGTEHWLDPATLGELPRYPDQPDVLSDWLRLRAPLPAAEAGVIVEVETVYHDHTPLFDGGSAFLFSAGHRGPIEYVRFVVEAPSELPLHLATDLLEAQPLESEEDGLRRWTYELGRMEGGGPIAPNLPGDVPRRPGIGVSTGESWAAVASRYHAIVEAQIADADLGTTVKKVLGNKRVRGELTRREQIARLVAWLHREVRYTGLEFGEAAIVPRSPGETLTRQYGDCKDKSTLLTVLLRDAGIPAHLALLDAGPGRDVMPSLPGLGRFDHAIVYVPAGSGEGEVWIDATAKHARIGQLPAADQDRWALVVRPETRELVRTPAATSADSGEWVERQIVLADIGAARVIEKSEYRGSQERLLRRVLTDLDDDKLREIFQKSIESAYQAEELVGFEPSDPGDLARPLSIAIEAAQANSIVTALDSATVTMSLNALVSTLYTSLGLGEEDSDEEGEAEARQQDFLLAEPYTAEHNLRIVPPVGFRAVDLPADETRQLGAASFEITVSRDDEGAVVVRAAFDSGPSRLSAAEYETLREKISEFVEDGFRVFNFEQVGEKLLAAGRLREALEELRRLAEIQPEQALHRTRIARALIAAGLGEAARREARRAAELDPENDLVQQGLGLVLARDLLGREFNAGMDYEAAETAWKKARDLESDNPIHRRNLAVLYEHDRDGERYGPRARLAEAIAEYRSLREDLDSPAADDNLLIALFRAERFAECRELAEELEPTVHRRALEIVSTAASEDFDAAHDKILTETEEVRNKILGMASELAVQIRHYQLAADFLSAVRGSESAAAILSQSSFLRRTKRFEEIDFDAADPRAFYFRTLRGTVLGDADGLAPLYRLAADNGLEREDVEWQFAASRLGFRAAWQNVPAESGLDVLVALSELSVDGDAETGYRLRALDDGEVNDVMYFAAGSDGLRLVAMQTIGGLSPIGHEVLRLLEAGQETAARRWLDWAREAAVAPDFDDPFGGDPVARFWKRGAGGDASRIRQAAASLIATGPGAGSVLADLEAGLAAAEEGDERRWQQARLAALFNAERYDDAVVAAKRLLAAEPASDWVFQLLTTALLELESWDEISPIARTRLEHLPDDVWARRLLSEDAQRQGDVELASKWLEEVVEMGRAEDHEYNNLAWFSLVLSAVDEQALDRAQQAVRLTGEASASSLHTLATVVAELGEPAAAREIVLQAMTAGGSVEPQSHDWYVLGRIAEHFGLLDAAVEAYRKVEPPEVREAESTSTYVLAQRKIAALAGGKEG